MLTPADLEVQIFVDPKEAKNLPIELKERMEKEVTGKGNVLCNILTENLLFRYPYKNRCFY